MDGLKVRLAEILDLVPAHSRVALIDEPVIRNIGDHLIHAGTAAFLADHGIEVAYRASLWSYDTRQARRGTDGRTVILLTGGGSVGDLYPAHQVLREQVVRDFPDNRIVVLPQSVRFERRQALERASRTFRAHRDLHLFVRERPSEDIAREHLAENVRLLPDMAHHLWPIPVAARGEPKGVLYLMRRDSEASRVPEGVAAHLAEFTDWRDHLGPGSTVAMGFCMAAGLASRSAGCRFGLDGVFRRESARLVRTGIELVARHETVVTSRLHGHILALLLTKPNLVLDNSYGKVASYHRQWTSGIDACRRAGS